MQGHTFVRTRPTDGSSGALRSISKKKGAVETNARDGKKREKGGEKRIDARDGQLKKKMRRLAFDLTCGRVASGRG